MVLYPSNLQLSFCNLTGVIPAKAGIHQYFNKLLDPRLRGDDNKGGSRTFIHDWYVSKKISWVPAFGGMTLRGAFFSFLRKSEYTDTED
ncbi:MAG: hypothetical protein H0X26_02460 [Alphaproteobacteria bacterium]|nr:hypothetical protein [Alphaproteobacteria bacterium]